MDSGQYFPGTARKFMHHNQFCLPMLEKFTTHDPTLEMGFKAQ